MSAYGSWYYWGYYSTGGPMTNARTSGLYPANPYQPTSAHTSCQVLRMDGTVAQIPSTIGYYPWYYLNTPDDGNVVGDY